MSISHKVSNKIDFQPQKKFVFFIFFMKKNQANQQQNIDCWDLFQQRILIVRQTAFAPGSIKVCTQVQTDIKVLGKHIQKLKQVNASKKFTY